MIKIINGNLLNCSQKVIVHQVNCKRVMGSGVALQIRNKYPEVYNSYLKFFNRNKIVELLGKIDIVNCIKDDKIVINMFSQFDFGRDKSKVYTNYSAMKLAFKRIRAYLIENNINELAMPFNIGCGLANGDWKVVSRLIDEIFENFTVYLYRI